MNKNITKLLTLVLMSGLMVSCNTNKNTNNDSGNNYGSDGSNGSGDTSSSQEDLTGWSKEIKEEMMTYLGEAIPFIQLDDATLQHGYSDYYEAIGIGIYYLYDDSPMDLLTGYDQILLDAGYIEGEEDGTVFYTKTTSLGDIFVSYSWYEATEDEAAGNSITVSCPVYVAPITEEDLIEAGYEKVQGFPRALVDATMDGSGYTLPAINENGTWYVASGEDEWDEGVYLCAYLATQGEYAEAYSALLLDLGLEYDEEEDGFFDSTGLSDFEIYVYENNGWTLFDILGPTLAPEEGEVVSEVVNQDGTIVITFTFEGVLIDQTDCGGRTFSSTSGSITCEKGNGGNNPKYYENGDTLRFYAKNTLEVNAITGYDISSVVLNIGSHKTMTGAASDFSVSKGSLVSENGVVTISNINAGSTLITFGPNASGGNIGLSSVVVTLVPIL